MKKIATLAVLAPFAALLSAGPVLAEETVIIKKHGDSAMHRGYSEGRTKKVIIKKDGYGNTTKKVIKSSDD